MKLEHEMVNLSVCALEILRNGIFDATAAKPYPLNQGICVTMRERINRSKTIDAITWDALLELRELVTDLPREWINKQASGRRGNSNYPLWVDLHDPCPENAYSQLRAPRYWDIDTDGAYTFDLQKEPSLQYDWFGSYTGKDGTPIALEPTEEPLNKFELDFIAAYRAERIKYLAYALRVIKELTVCTTNNQ